MLFGQDNNLKIKEKKCETLYQYIHNIIGPLQSFSQDWDLASFNAKLK